MQEFIEHFGIDWKLLLAQMVNFALLLFILRRFVYRPVLDVLQKRKQKIEEGIQFAKDAEFELKRIQELREEILEGAKRDGVNIVTEAEEKANHKKEEILQEALQKTEAAIVEAKRVIQEEKVKMTDSLQKETEELVLAGVAKVLGKMSPGTRDRVFVEEALRELKILEKK